MRINNKGPNQKPMDREEDVKCSSILFCWLINCFIILAKLLQYADVMTFLPRFPQQTKRKETDFLILLFYPGILIFMEKTFLAYTTMLAGFLSLVLFSSF